MIGYLSDTLVELQGTVNEQTARAVISTGTVTMSLYHDERESELDAAELVSGATTDWSVKNPGKFEIGDNAVLERNDESIHDGGAITAISVKNGTITVTNVLTTDDADKGKRVMVRLGVVITMAAYGTPVIDTFSWGFDGIIDSGHGDLLPGMSVRIEVTLDSGGVKLTDFIHDHVSGGV